MSQEIRIDKNVPMPPQRAKYPFTRMKVGESCFIPDWSTSTGAHGYVRHLRPARFMFRNATKRGIKGVRVWRIE